MSLARSFLVVCAAAALWSPIAGCSVATFIVQQYDGPARPRESISILRVRGDESVRLIRLDAADANAPIENDVRLHIELLPGEHSLDVANAAAPEYPVQRVSFRAEPGRVYQVFFVKPAVLDTKGPAARVYEVGDDSDTPLRDVTLPKTEPKDPRPRVPRSG